MARQIPMHAFIIIYKSTPQGMYVNQFLPKRSLEREKLKHALAGGKKCEGLLLYKSLILNNIKGLWISVILGSLVNLLI